MRAQLLALLVLVAVAPAAGAIHQSFGFDEHRYVGAPPVVEDGDALAPCTTPSVHVAGICREFEIPLFQDTPMVIEVDDTVAQHTAARITTIDFAGDTTGTETFCDRLNTTLPTGTSKLEVRVLPLEVASPCPIVRAAPTAGVIHLS